MANNQPRKSDTQIIAPAQSRPANSSISQRCAALLNSARLKYRLSVGATPGTLRDR